MAAFKVDGLEDLTAFFDDISSLPDSVTSEMLNAEADVVADEQRKTASSMLHGPYFSGAVSASIRKRSVRSSGSGKEIDITFEGTQHGNRISEIAFINEFGKSGQAARPFIRTANERCAERAVEAAADVYQAWLDGQ